MKRKVWALLLSAAMLLAICLPALCAAAESGAGESSVVEETFDVAAAKSELLAKTSEADVNSYLSALSESERETLINELTEAEIRDLAARLQVNLEETIITPAKNYTDVGELKPPVTVTSRMLRSLRLAEEEPENGLILDKNSTYNADSKSVTIRMEAYTTGTVTSSESAIPTDIVLVLDESGSMADKINQYTKVYSLNKNETYYVKSGDSYIQVQWCNGGLFSTHEDGWYSGGHFIIHWGSRYEPMTSETDTTSGHVQFYQASAANISKQQALIKAATQFVNDVYANATTNDVDHRVSVIGFSNNGAATTKVGLVNDIRNNYQTVLTAVSGLNANGGTYIEDGMANAKAAFDNAAATTATKRNRVVVVFTDGIPGSGSWGNSTISNSANPAIQTSYELKNTYGATVYTIGMLNDANPELEISDESNDSARTNKFLHYLSSNYPNAKSMSDGGTGSNQGYYLSASDTASLEAIFKKISESISTPSISLGSETVIRDILAEQFTMPANASDIKVYTADATSANGATWASPVLSNLQPTIEGNTVSVSGFDFNANFVSDNAKPDGSFGKKLIIEFTAPVREGFFGGNNVATNGTDSGVYLDGEQIETFEVPQVNIPLNVPDFAAVDRNIYLLGNAPAAADLCDLSAYTSADAWKVAYVQFADPALGAETVSNTQDSTVTIAVTVSPKTNGNGANGTPAQSVEKTAVAQVNVFKPELTFQDSEIYLGEQANYLQQNVLATQWKHGKTLDTEVSMTGAAPTLGRTYNPVEGAFAEETDVTVSTAIGGVDVTAYTTFVNADDASTDHQFTVKVKTCTLTIQKSGAQAIDENQSFLFRITGAGNAKAEQVNLTVTVVGNGSAVVRGLPIGTYTVSEESGWSWRYTAEAGQQSAVLAANAQQEAAVLTFENTRTAEKWLDGSAYAENAFGAVSQ